METIESVKHSAIKYMEELDAELATIPGYSKPKETETEKKCLKSHTDKDCGYIHQKRKEGLGYLVEMTVDTKHGIITGVDYYPANKREREIILEHLKNQSCRYQKIALDTGYGIGAVHRGLELLDIDGYTATREYQNNPMRKGFRYDEQRDAFICRQGEALLFQELIYKKSSQNYYRLYTRSRTQCKECLLFQLVQQI